MNNTKQQKTTDKRIHIRKKVAGGTTGAVLGAFVGGPVGALVGGVIGTALGSAAESGKLAQLSSVDASRVARQGGKEMKSVARGVKPRGTLKRAMRPKARARTKTTSNRSRGKAKSRR